MIIIETIMRDAYFGELSNWVTHHHHIWSHGPSPQAKWSRDIKELALSESTKRLAAKRQ